MDNTCNTRKNLLGNVWICDFYWLYGQYQSKSNHIAHASIQQALLICRLIQCVEHMHQGYSYTIELLLSEIFIQYFRVFPSLKKEHCTENKKRALLIFLGAYFWFPKTLLNLKVYDTFNKYCKKVSFLTFFTKGQEGCNFF